jgi:hypothetical protein
MERSSLQNIQTKKRPADRSAGRFITQVFFIDPARYFS